MVHSNGCEVKKVTDSSYDHGRWLASPAIGEEVVISGLAGSYPNSRTVYEFQENLFNKADMVSDDDRRWKINHPEIPQRTGKLYNIEKLDAGYFGIHEHQAHTMDPIGRLFMEKAIEAIVDAGYNPKELEGTNTGIFVGVCFSESEKTWFFDKLQQKRFAITGCMRSMIANRMSYHLKLKGPSCITDSACSSSLYALEHAYRAIREGKCDAAIVAGINVCLHPIVSLQFARLGVLSLDGTCKVFDEHADGYARSEGTISIFLQKAKNARRIYSQVVHAKSNCDGYKEQGITFPSGAMQNALLKKFYRECQINPADLTYLEAHGTGTTVGDPEEIVAMDEVFCKKRKTPLLLGSVKSNIGHGEPSSGLSSITKAVIAFETGIIPPNLNYTTPRSGVEALEKGRFKVVTECTSLPDNNGLIGVNSFGFGGANCHVLLRWHNKPKINNGLSKDNLPRLVCVSGRIENSIISILDDIKERLLDAEYVNLYHRIFSKETLGHLYRGFSIVTKSRELKRSSKYFAFDKKPLYLVFSNFGINWKDIAKDLFALPLFVGSVQRIHDILSKTGINITDILLNEKKKSNFDQILGTMAVQIGIVDLIKTLKIEPNGYFGYGFGEFICGYFDGSIELKETVLCVHEILSNLQKSKQDFSYTNGFWAELQTQLPQLEKKLNGILKRSTPKSNKWLSSPEVKNTSAKYFLQSISNSKNSVFDRIEKNAIILEIGDLESQAKIFETNKYNFLNFENKENENYLVIMLELLGSLYEYGYNFDLEVIYPKVQYPVSRGTPMISPLIKWNHTHDWFVTSCRNDDEITTRQDYLIHFSMKDEIWQFITGHVIDGRNLFPATGYLSFAWEGFSLIKKMKDTDMQLVMENCKFRRATKITKDTNIAFHVSVQKGTGNFEINDGSTTVVSGKIYLPKNFMKQQFRLPTFDDVVDSEEVELSTKDIYKELRLRGYNYSGAFKKITSCNLDLTKAYVKWDGNWITFMDNMLQLKILQTDTRNLYVPTGIKRCSIDFKKHLAYVESFGEQEPNLPVYIYKKLGIIRSGGIEICGIEATAIAKRKSRSDPVLEKYVFVPNAAKLDLNTLIRVNMQLTIENSQGIKIKSVEIFNDTSRDDLEPLSPIIYEVLCDLPLIQANMVILSKKQLKYPNFVIENKALSTETDCNLVVGENILQKGLILQQALSALKENGFILTREQLDFQFDALQFRGIQCLTEFQTENEKLLLLRKNVEIKSEISIEISNEKFDWIEKLQDGMTNDANIIIYTQNEAFSGILGLVNCLRREPGGHKIRCVFLQDQAPVFDLNNNFYSEQLKKNLIVNVYKNSEWGTYRHLLLDEADEVESEHFYANTLVRGDLSSFKWIKGPLTPKTILPPEEELIHVHYSALNFRDVMLATGRLSADIISSNRIQQKYIQGFEFAGCTAKGKRVMGLTVNSALATLTNADKYYMWEVPDNWSLDEAATVPVVYTTVLYCFFWEHKLKRGETVLIHSGTGGVGQAAIHVALHHGCTVYTTVGTEEKRRFLKRRFPQLTDKHIGNSRDTSFEQMIFDQTEGRGVDIVLNSLAEEKLLASVRCLAEGGNFFEIGKFDFANNNPLKLMFLKKNASFHGIIVDKYFTNEPWRKQEFTHVFKKALDNGYIRPLNRNIFKTDELEKAFRYMTTGKHIGKVLIEIRKESSQRNISPTVSIKKGMPQFHCNSNSSYIIAGGLGGFGLELADWLVLRGACNLILSSRTGISNGYQSYRIKIYKSYGCHVKISTNDITTEEGCKQLIEEANKIAPVAGIFNLAVVLKDAFFENQNIENFVTSFETKAFATKYLDEISRKLCPNLKNFVVFSSVSCGRGNAGQTNYGMSNSVMERICERRRQDGLPATAIEWGAVGDVGLVAQMQEENTEIEIGGTLQQRISNCLEVLDVLLSQTYPVVSSMVVAEKRGGLGSADNMVDAVANIIGLRDIKTVSFHSTLAEMGMDSMTGVEIKQTLEREFEVFLTATDIRSLTFARLLELQEERNSEDSSSAVIAEKKSEGFDMILRLISDEATSKLPVVEHKTKITNTANAPKVIFLPGIEGVAKVLEPLTSNLHVHALVVQFLFDNSANTFKELALSILPHVEKNISKTKPFNIVAYSYGTITAIELVHVLEEKGYSGHLICIDGSYKLMIEILKKQLELTNDHDFEIYLLCQIMALFVPLENIANNKDKLSQCKTFEEKLELTTEIVPKSAGHTKEYYRSLIIGAYKRIKCLINYKPKFDKLKSKITLFKPQQHTVIGIEDDYGLSELCKKAINIQIFKGNHVTMLENLEMAEAVDKLFIESDIIEKDTNCEGRFVVNLANFAT